MPIQIGYVLSDPRFNYNMLAFLNFPSTITIRYLSQPPNDNCMPGQHNNLDLTPVSHRAVRRHLRNNITSKTPSGRGATVGCGLLGPGRPRHRVTTGRNTLWNAPGGGITALTHLGAS